MGDNIRHERETVINQLATINKNVHMFSSNYTTSYEAIITGISKSSCEHMDALIEQIEEEKRVVSEITSFFLKLSSMMDTASESLEAVEASYSHEKVDTGGMMKE